MLTLLSVRGETLVSSAFLLVFAIEGVFLDPSAHSLVLVLPSRMLFRFAWWLVSGLTSFVSLNRLSQRWLFSGLIWNVVEKTASVD